ncbi:AAA family ATPase [Pseudobutyrivibrio xylanivorans]|uniref:AAA family ATPase n=1 Tax=Pseudobutyrivibrio xylanivorans TaxID=185007 RepID=A0A5P6VMQ7_PSEXY|nr:AAA family ATPase [Pseudobutyrivibrio xylanivorans]QFJ53935.1 AAA family ATPase [Pseudobutyrivibrio xylanivorans]
MLRCIRINGLFGRFDYELVLNSGGITVITGPNGFGKSTTIYKIPLCRIHIYN